MHEAPVADPISALAGLAAPRDPYPLYAQVREASPVCWSDLIGSWILSRYGDCAHVLHDYSHFASDWRRIGENMPESMLSIQALDPPEHTSVRHLLVDAVRAIDYRSLENMIGRQVRARLDKLRRRAAFNFMTEFAAPLALDTITDVLGCPLLDRDRFLSLSQVIVDGMDAGIWPEAGPPAVAARADLAQLIGELLDRSQAEGIASYAATRAAHAGVTRPVLLNSLRAFLHAGFESASRLLGNGLAVLLMEQGMLLRFLRSDHFRAVDEIVRLASPVQADSRACVTETKIGKQIIAPDSPVTMLLGAANRDPLRFANPDVIDFTRHPNPHLGFGRGVHSCLGQPLAVVQTRVVFSILAAECPGIRAVSTPVYRRNLTLRGVDRLEVCLG